MNERYHNHHISGLISRYIYIFVIRNITEDKV